MDEQAQTPQTSTPQDTVNTDGVVDVKVQEMVESEYNESVEQQPIIQTTEQVTTLTPDEIVVETTPPNTELPTQVDIGSGEGQQTDIAATQETQADTKVTATETSLQANDVPTLSSDTISTNISTPANSSSLPNTRQEETPPSNDVGPSQDEATTLGKSTISQGKEETKNSASEIHAATDEILATVPQSADAPHAAPEITPHSQQQHSGTETIEAESEYGEKIHKEESKGEAEDEKGNADENESAIADAVSATDKSNVTETTIPTNTPDAQPEPTPTPTSADDATLPLFSLASLHLLLKKAQVALRERKQKRIDSIMNLFEANQTLTSKSVSRHVHVSQSTAQRYLSLLERQGKVRQIGKTGRRVVYVKI
jgi:hypothetical protein